MQKISKTENCLRLLCCFIVLGIIAAFIILPRQFNAVAADEKESKNTAGRQKKTFEDYDIRHQKRTEVSDALVSFRESSGKSASDIADLRDGFVNGEKALKRKVPNLKVEYNRELHNPEVIAPDVMKGGGFLTAPAGGKNAEVLRGFLREYNGLTGLHDEQINKLKVTADYKNPRGNLSFVRLEQFIDKIPVFRAEVRAGFTKNGEMFRAVNNLAPGLEYTGLSKNFGDPAEAVRQAAGYIDYQLKENDLTLNNAASTDLKAVFGEGDWATTAEKMYFPLEAGVARPAWRVLNWQSGDVYYVIVDAETGMMLYRENITKSQTQQATYNVYANTTSLLKTMANPAPLSPNPIDPGLGTQGVLQPRTNVTLIGNEAPYTFNNLGWITDNTNGTNGITDGNNVEAGVDRDATNGVDAPVAGTNRVFNFDYTPGSGGINGTGDSPLLVPYQNGASTHLFYVTNRFHDETYLLGFTEPARNFQHDNFSRGGSGNDRISAEAQDNTVGGSCQSQPCVNNANFSTPADGGRGRMQMYIWDRMDPDRDGDLDAEIIVHELTHGLFGRLHNGVAGTQAGQMNEGNSDFFAHVLLALNSDPIDGIYVTGGYSTLNLRMISGGTGNYYYGIRRFPKAVKSFTGGPNNRPHNPLTFADIDPAQMNLTDGAFSPAFTGSATSVHDGGEVWSSMLWEVRARLVNRLGAAVGNKMVLQFVMDGMKISPTNPTMIQERNAILAATLAGGTTTDFDDVWAGFAARGLGFSATNPSGNTVVEAFDLPNLVQTPAFTVSDAIGNNNGFPEPGETLTLTVPLTNSTGKTATGVTLQVVGGGSAKYGTINNNSTVTQQVTYTVPAGTTCGSALTLNFNVTSNLGPTSFSRIIIIGTPQTTFTENFDGVTVPAFPANWTAEAILGGTNFVTTATNPDTAPNSAFALDPTTVGGGTNLTSPSIPITASAATVSFRNRYHTEAGWDGGVLEISINGGAFQDIIAAGGRFIENGYNGILGPQGANNPLAGRNAWNGNSNGYLTTIVQLPASAAGQNVQLRWRFGADDNTAETGWNVDTIKVVGNYGCSVSSNSRTPFDFDGDRKSDIGIWRQSVGEWWLLRSTQGLIGTRFGLPTDIITPGDFTGDGKTDIAFWRPSTGFWYVLRSEDSLFFGFKFGQPGDIPAPADFDGDGITDAALFRPSIKTWVILNSSNGSITIRQFGLPEDKPIPADYDGDGRADIAIWRQSVGEWWLLRSTQGLIGIKFGTSTDITVTGGDWTGDGRADIAFFRPSTGFWFVLRSEDFLHYGFKFGAGGDHLAPADYDGDGKIDAAIVRPDQKTWYILRSSDRGVTIRQFGLGTDRPVASAYIRP